MPESKRILRTAGGICSAVLVTVAVMAYSDFTSERNALEQADLNHVHNYANYIYCLLALVSGLTSMCSLRRSQCVSISVIIFLLGTMTVIGFIVSGVYAIAVGYKIQCCFDVMVNFEHIEGNANELYQCNSGNDNGENDQCNLKSYLLVGIPWLVLSVLNCLFVIQIVHTQMYAKDLELEDKEYREFAERTNLVTQLEDGTIQDGTGDIQLSSVYDDV